MSATTSMTPEMDALKTRLKTTWESGDYGVFAKYLEPGALQFFERLNIPAGTRLLDIACGAGQLTIPAAQEGDSGDRDRSGGQSRGAGPRQSARGAPPGAGSIRATPRVFRIRMRRSMWR